jgi:mRNA-degrading endonuclease toxin of MazEF toxin-antitoxin module
MISCKNGDIVAVRLEDTGGDEEQIRYAVIISADIINENLQTVIVCPIIKAPEINISRIGATYIKKDDVGLDLNSLVLSLQIKTVSKDRILKSIGVLPANYRSEIKESLQAVLELDS